MERPTAYNNTKRLLEVSTIRETYIPDTDFNCDPNNNPQIFDITTQIFKHRENTPFEEYIRLTGMIISTDHRKQKEAAQLFLEYIQDAERITEIRVDHTNPKSKSILKTKEPKLPIAQYHTIADQRPRNQPYKTRHTQITNNGDFVWFLPTRNNHQQAHYGSRWPYLPNKYNGDLQLQTANKENLKFPAVATYIHTRDTSLPSSRTSQWENGIEEPLPLTRDGTSMQSGCVKHGSDTSAQGELQSYPKHQIAG